MGILALGAYLVITQAATPGVMGATTILPGRALAPVKQVVGSWKVLVEARIAYHRLSELLRAPAAPDAMALPAPTGALEADSLIVRVPGSDRLPLAGVSLSLAAGGSLAVIGPSGGPRSMAMRWWPPRVPPARTT